LKPRILALGDLGAYIELSRTLDLKVNARAQRLARALQASRPPELRDIVPALGGVALHFAPDFQGSVLARAQELLDATGARDLPDAEANGREVVVPVCYDETFGPDLHEVCGRTGLDTTAVARLHAQGDYRVLMMGFAPGHAYIGGLDERLSVPRRASPRAVVPAGSVAIANQQTVIYPFAISGGWSVIGRTPLAVFDARRAEPSLLAAGDRVRFRAIDRDEFTRIAEAHGR